MVAMGPAAGPTRCRPATSYPPTLSPEGGSIAGHSLALLPLIAKAAPGILAAAAGTVAAAAASVLGQKLISKAVTTGVDALAEQKKREQTAEQKEAQLRLEAELEQQRLQHELEREQEAARERLELEAAQREARFQEREREITAAEERLASLPRSEASTTQSQQQAAAYLRLLKSRYPNIFALRPELGPYVEGQVLGALLAPADPTDPLYLQKVVGELEFQLARAQQQIDPSLDYTPPEQPPPGQKKYAEAPLWSKPGPKKKKGKGYTTALLGCGAAPPRRHAMFGGGVAAVIDP